MVQPTTCDLCNRTNYVLVLSANLLNLCNRGGMKSFTMSKGRNASKKVGNHCSRSLNAKGCTVLGTNRIVAFPLFCQSAAKYNGAENDRNRTVFHVKHAPLFLTVNTNVNYHGSCGTPHDPAAVSLGDLLQLALLPNSQRWKIWTLLFSLIIHHMLVASSQYV